MEVKSTTTNGERQGPENSMIPHYRIYNKWEGERTQTIRHAGDLVLRLRARGVHRAPAGEVGHASFAAAISAVRRDRVRRSLLRERALHAAAVDVGAVVAKGIRRDDRRASVTRRWSRRRSASRPREVREDRAAPDDGPVADGPRSALVEPPVTLGPGIPRRAAGDVRRFAVATRGQVKTLMSQ